MRIFFPLFFKPHIFIIIRERKKSYLFFLSTPFRKSIIERTNDEFVENFCSSSICGENFSCCCTFVSSLSIQLAVWWTECDTFFIRCRYRISSGNFFFFFRFLNFSSFSRKMKKQNWKSRLWMSSTCRAAPIMEVPGEFLFYIILCFYVSLIATLHCRKPAKSDRRML